MTIQEKPAGCRRHLNTVTVERPWRPACGGVKLRKYRALADQGDGSALWWVRCQCGRRFRKRSAADSGRPAVGPPNHLDGTMLAAIGAKWAL